MFPIEMTRIGNIKIIYLEYLVSIYYFSLFLKYIYLSLFLKLLYCFYIILDIYNMNTMIEMVANLGTSG